MRFVLMCLAVLASLAPARAQVPSFPVDYVEEPGKLLVQLGGRPVQLETLVVKRKDAQGRLPIALITHGQAPTDSGRGATTAASFSRQARDMAWRGWLAVVVVRRGYGASDGPILPGPACKGEDFASYFRENGRDLAAVLPVIAARADAKADTVIAIGHSMGGASVLGLAALAPPGLKAVVNLSGGLRKTECENGGARERAEAIAALAPAIKVPSLWVYAANDSFFSPASVDQMYEAAIKGGMNVQRVALPDIDKDGHYLFGIPAGRLAILKALDPFLRLKGLPTWPTALNAQVQKALDGTEPTPQNVRNLELFASAPSPTVVGYSPSAKRYFLRYGGRNIEVATEAAQKDCTEAGLKDCVFLKR